MTSSDTDLALSAPVNLRDLGGIAIDGGVLCKGFAIRTDDLAYVTAEVAEQLVSGGLTAIIDLRSPFEAAVTGRGPLAKRPVAYHHLPLIADIGEAIDRERPSLTHEAMGRMYQQMVEGAAPQLAIALTLIAHTPGTAAFHCAAGRDRTGVLAAVLLLALGATDDDIVTDYARTGDNMAAIIARTTPVMGAMRKALGFDADAPGKTSALLEGAMEVSMRNLLEALREQHGDPLTPLRDAGLSDATITRLRERALAV